MLYRSHEEHRPRLRERNRGASRGFPSGAHLPFPGPGHLRRDPDRYTWVPVTYTPVE
jgi:hypothetical protein